jgi:hypothetical protein
VHACAVHHLPWWLDAELWVIDLDDPVVDHGRVLLARRGRLIERVEGWDGEAARAFSEACAWHARDLAISALVEFGRHTEGEQLRACATTTALFDAAKRLADRLPHPLGDTVGYCAETAMAVDWGNANLVAFGAALAAASDAQRPGHLLTPASAVRAERAWQAAWLAEDLALHG